MACRIAGVIVVSFRREASPCRSTSLLRAVTAPSEYAASVGIQMTPASFIARRAISSAS